MKNPKVFVSYSHDSDDHKTWVRRLASDLMQKGVDVILDQWSLALGEDMAAFMTNSVSGADRVILICSDRYVQKADEGSGGVGYERLIVSAEVAARIDTKKFIPVMRNNTARLTPKFLGARRYEDFSSEDGYATALETLAREIHGLPSVQKPELGPNPYAATLPLSPAVDRSAGSTGVLQSGAHILSDAWFDQRATDATTGLSKLKLAGGLAVRFAPHEALRKSQMDLLSAVRNSQVHTFGWPFGIVLDNRDEAKPRPFSDGVRAEVSIPQSPFDGKPTYDYWAARSTGDFFALQSYFEDSRAQDVMFFNSRIVRTTEVFMFAAAFYRQLGAAADARISFRFQHSGLTGRTLASSNFNRNVWPRKSSEEASEVEIADSLTNLEANIVANVQKVLSPTFMLFDFAEFDQRVYEDIVTEYLRGRVT